jgi:Fe2+ transport system protein B
MEGDAQLRITNSNGYTLLTQPICIKDEDVEIKLPDLKPGIYFVTIISNEAVITRKLVIAGK